MEKIIFALDEEIGDTDFFIGREKELEFFLNWAELVKKKTIPIHGHPRSPKKRQDRASPTIF